MQLLGMLASMEVDRTHGRRNPIATHILLDRRCCEQRAQTYSISIFTLTPLDTTGPFSRFTATCRGFSLVPR